MEVNKSSAHLTPPRLLLQICSLAPLLPISSVNLTGKAPGFYFTTSLMMNYL